MKVINLKKITFLRGALSLSSHFRLKAILFLEHQRWKFCFLRGVHMNAREKRKSQPVLCCSLLYWNGWATAQQLSMDKQSQYFASAGRYSIKDVKCFQNAAAQTQTTNPKHAPPITTFFLVKSLCWNGSGTTQYHYLFRLHFRPERKSMHHKSGCQRNHQNRTFLFDWAWWSALPLNYAAWINLSWKMSGKVEWWYLISTDATPRGHQKEADEESSGGCVTAWGEWLARLSPGLVNAVNSMLHQRKNFPALLFAMRFSKYL